MDDKGKERFEQHVRKIVAMPRHELNELAVGLLFQLFENANAADDDEDLRAAAYWHDRYFDGGAVDAVVGTPSP
jgi:hypothetical protein